MKRLGLLGILFLIGCAHQERVPARPEPATIAGAPQTTAEAPQQPAPVQPDAHAANPISGAAADAVATPPSARPPSEAPRSKPASAAPRVAAASPPVVAASASPKPAATLDLAALEQRLRDTRAIGVFTKLSLKNQVDDLLDTVRDYHSGQRSGSLQDVRQQYDSLLAKVLSLLQNGDPALASSIRGSRDAIWNLLADRDQFQKMHL